MAHRHHGIRYSGGKVYLSQIIDCFDGMPVAWTISTSPSAELVNTILDNAVQKFHENEYPIIHSDRDAIIDDLVGLIGWIQLE